MDSIYFRSYNRCLRIHRVNINACIITRRISNCIMEHNIVERRKKKFNFKKRKNKLVLVFDENDRREFLTGFHKRKLQRRTKAKEEFERQLKFERKRIKAEARNQYKKLLLSQKPIPELEDLLSEEIDMGTHSVSVTELSTADIAKKNNWIGINEVQYEEKDRSKKNKTNIKLKNNSDLEGMTIKNNSKNKYENKNNSAKSCKDIKKTIKQQATLNVKKSKIFQKKSKIEKIKNMKKQKREERKQEKRRKKDKRSKQIKK